MNKIWTIIEKELKHYFYSPIAYVVMVVFLSLTGFFFYVGLTKFNLMYENYKNLAEMTQNPQYLEGLNLNDIVIAPSLFNMAFILLFLIPLLMMRSFAEEKSKKTDELLKTAPLSITHIVWGKYISAFLFVMLMILPTVVYQIFLFASLDSPPELGPILTGYVSVMLYSGAALAMGMFASSLTENQIVAAVMTFVALLLLFVISSIGLKEGSMLYSLVQYISIPEHMKSMLRGVVDTRDIIYFLSLSGLFIFLTHRSLDVQGWR